MFTLSSALSDIGLSLIRKITDLWRGAKSDSLIDYTQVARVEPIVLIDTDCLYLDSISEVQQSLLSIFAGYYLQAVAISTSIGKIEVMHHLDKLNPRRNASDSAANTMGWLLAQESYKHALPTFENKISLEVGGPNAGPPTNSDWTNDAAQDNYLEELSLKERTVEAQERAARNSREANRLREADSKQKHDEWVADNANRLAKDGFDRDATTRELELKVKQFEEDKKQYGEQYALNKLKYNLDKSTLRLRKQERKDKLSASEIGFGRDTMKDLKELANLSVGKMFSVDITDGLHKASIMVSIRLMASSLPSANIVRILSIGSKDNSAKERYHAWKAGRLEFIKDLVLCQDLIDAHRKNLMADKDGIYTNILKRARTNQLSTIVSGNPSIATASNICIISSNTAEKLELETNLKLSDAHSRDKIFQSTYMMLLCILDPEWNRVTIYSRGIRDAIEVSTKDLKAANSKDGLSVTDVLAAYKIGNNPSI